MSRRYLSDVRVKSDPCPIDWNDLRSLMYGMTEEHWEHFAHSSDVGVRGFGPSREAAFSQAALAMMAVMVDVGTIEPREMVSIQCQESDADLLLLAWLNAVIYEVDVRHMLFSRFSAEISGDSLVGKGWGEPMDTRRHELLVEVKAATLAELRVYRDQPGTWVAQCVVDV